MTSIIQIAALPNGAHNNQRSSAAISPPEGWALIPEAMWPLNNFPFGEVEATEIDGVTTLVKWTPLPVPEPEPEPEPTPSEKRENAYNTEKRIEWGGKELTVTEAAQLWEYYASEGSEKADELTALIAAAKANIRERYPDEEG